MRTNQELSLRIKCLIILTLFWRVVFRWRRHALESPLEFLRLNRRFHFPRHIHKARVAFGVSELRCGLSP